MIVQVRHRPRLWTLFQLSSVGSALKIVQSLTRCPVFLQTEQSKLLLESTVPFICISCAFFAFRQSFNFTPPYDDTLHASVTTFSVYSPKFGKSRGKICRAASCWGVGSSCYRKHGSFWLHPNFVWKMDIFDRLLFVVECIVPNVCGKCYADMTGIAG